MSNYDIQLLQGHIRDLREEIEAIKRALARTRISVGHTGNQWWTIPPAPKKGEGDGGEAPEYDGVPAIARRDAGTA